MVGMDTDFWSGWVPSESGFPEVYQRVGGLLYQRGRFAHGVDALSEGCRVSLHPFSKGMEPVSSGLFFHHSSVNFHDG